MPAGGPGVPPLQPVTVTRRSPIRAESGPNLSPLLDFMRLVWAVSHGLQRRSKHMERTLGVTGPQRLVIRIVGQMPGVSAGHLARILHIHPSTLTGILRRLEERGFIRRRAASDDARRVELSLTASGRRINSSLRGTVEAAVAEALGTLAADEVEQGKRVLKALADALERTVR